MFHEKLGYWCCIWMARVNPSVVCCGDHAYFHMFSSLPCLTSHHYTVKAKIFSRLWGGWSSVGAWWGADIKRCAKLVILIQFANFRSLVGDPYRLSRKILSFWRFRVLGACFRMWNSFSALWNSFLAPWNYFSAPWNSFSAPWNYFSAPWNSFSAPWNSFLAPWNYFSAS